MNMSPVVTEKFASYPEDIRGKLFGVRQLVFEVAAENGIEDLTETLKWQQPSYLTKHGSTVRIDWSLKHPEHYYVYFHCQTLLVETFKEHYREVLEFEGNRAIVLKLSEPIPKIELGHCILLSLQYHKIKHLPLLGA